MYTLYMLYIMRDKITKWHMLYKSYIDASVTSVGIHLYVQEYTS